VGGGGEGEERGEGEKESVLESVQWRSSSELGNRMGKCSAGRESGEDQGECGARGRVG
jgi:hypothetical protein